MSEELYGGPALERDAGFSPMELAPEPSKSTDIGSNSSSLREVANQRVADRGEPEQGLDEVSYKKADERGRPTRERSDPRETVKLARAAKDLASYRRSEIDAKEREQANLVRAHADALRGGRQSPLDQQSPQPEQQNLLQNVAPQGQAYQQSPSHGYDQQLVAGARDSAATRRRVALVLRVLIRVRRETGKE